MMDLNDKEVCRECGAYSSGNGYCGNLPGHPFAGVSLEEYVAAHPDDTAAAEYLRGRNEERSQAAAVADWKAVLGEPGSVRRTPRPDVDLPQDGKPADRDWQELMAYGGGPSFDDVYTTSLLDWVFESRNVGRHDGHMANLVVTRNETGLPWTDGWSKGDEALDVLISAAMEELDKERDKPLAAARTPAAGAKDAPTAAASTSFNPFSE